MPDRRLVVLEADSTDPNFGKMFGVAPNRATGIPIPTFQVGATLPAVGTNIGDAYYDSTTRQAYVWNGAAWLDVAANPIRQFPNDAALLADTVLPTGSYAISSATGNLYIRKTTGWQRLGITEYATVTDLLASAPARGTLGEALDEGSLWERTSTGWRVTQIRELADTAAVLAWAGTPAQGANPGDQAVALDVDVMYIRTSSGWRPDTLWEDTEANIRAATWPINGQEAIATDTGRTFARIGGAWIEEPINHYATEAALLAAAPPDGTLAWSDDTQVVFTRAAGAWNRLGGITMAVGSTAPATPASGALWYDNTHALLKLWDGTHWRGVNGCDVGTGSTGASTRMPGYFNQNPSATADAADYGGLAFRYTGTQKQLFIEKSGNWAATTPLLNNSNNAGMAVIADSAGNPTTYKRFPDFAGDEIAGTSDRTVDINGPFSTIQLDGWFTPSDNTHLLLIGQANGGWISWGGIEHSFASCQYKDGGYEYNDLSGSTSWHQGNGGISLTRDTRDYLVGNGHLCTFSVKIHFANVSHTTIRSSCSYLSDNGTSFISDASYQTSLNLRGIMNRVGIKCHAGTMVGSLSVIAF